jgi:SAM-dependent methyltransferase
LVLSDLRKFLQRFATDSVVKVLDFGAGTSPYRQLFPNSDYKRADFVPAEGIDYIVPADSSLPLQSDSFDIVLSTQVAEHVEDPKNYFFECYRVLRPGGILILTTHGVWEDHGAPYDFQRWTLEGLTRDLRNAGFHQLNGFKLTTAGRCYSFLIIDWLCKMQPSSRSIFARGFAKTCRVVAPKLLPVFNWLADKTWVGCSVVDERHAPLHPFYAIIAATGVKPEVQL